MNLSEYKDVIKFAMTNEVEAQKFYAEAAEKLRNPALKKMFTQFSEEEKRHREILKKIYVSNTIGDYFKEETDYKVSETVDEPELSMDMKPADAFALAMKKEEDAVVQYTALANECRDPEKKKIFMDLAAMESGHKRKMEDAFVDVGYPEVW